MQLKKEGYCYLAARPGCRAIILPGDEQRTTASSHKAEAITDMLPVADFITNMKAGDSETERPCTVNTVTNAGRHTLSCARETGRDRRSVIYP